ncbi:methytransferase partner Trm112 [Halobaculum litoreum]|uniref:Methytransferase partner Trm112 n=1 Tax=Halobaculum litoreum TaxID=3031998 RepID=A0ABD5XZ84_9EURY|nr:methytransferase partner Trm112 [Halobaculum sp. DT92]
MKESLLDIVCCPLDKHDLELEVTEREAGEDGEIVEGTLTCTDCGETYPIEDGIPNLLPPDMRDE